MSKNEADKYIPALKLVSRQFTNTRDEYRMATAWGVNACATYQEALNEATEAAIEERSQPPTVRVDGFEFKKDEVIPIVLKEVEMVELTTNTGDIEKR